ncbi:MAG: hypothetical protein GXO77_05890 [Calditrichaeota bacterium]|nr:hypothetical protein [Calditrichota bacterium]
MFKHFLKINLFLFLLAAFCYSQIERFPGSQLRGRWVGKGKIIVDWCKQDSLSFDFVIHEDGKISGKIGDAQIKKGKLRLNSFLLNFLGNSQYLLEAELEGPLVKAEGIERPKIKLFLDYRNNRLVGGFHSSGKKSGAEKSMKLSGSGLALIKQ